MATSNRIEADTTESPSSKKRRLTPNDENEEKIKNPISSNVFEQLYLNARSADVHFTFGASEDRIPAHKAMLAVSSPVFDAEFYGLMAEKNDVRINDEGVDAAAYKEFLQFFYLKEIKLSKEHVQSVLYLCHKYQLDECATVCSEFLKKNLTIDQMCLGYQLAVRYERNDLKEFCRREICLNGEQIVKSEGFLNCDWNILSEMMKSFKFVCNESSLLEACIKWSENACRQKELDAGDKENIRNQLKDVIYNIRFNKISTSELATYLVNSLNSPYNGVELENIIRIIGGKETNFNFNCSYRFDQFPWVGRVDCKQYDGFVNEYTIPYTVSSIFTANKMLTLRQFHVFRIKEHMDSADATSLKISCKISSEKVNFKPKTIEVFGEKSEPDALYQIFFPTFPEPIIIEENIKYKIEIDFLSNAYKSNFKMMEKVKLKNDIMITFYRDTSSDFDNLNKGVIPWLNFNEIDF